MYTLYIKGCFIKQNILFSACFLIYFCSYTPAADYFLILQCYVCESEDFCDFFCLLAYQRKSRAIVITKWLWLGILAHYD